MKHKVVGWTDYDDSRKSAPVSYAKYCALVREIREKDYFFAGEDHQDRPYCAPVFNDGTKGILSRRGFGGCMADAHGYTDPYDYALFTESVFIKKGKYPKYTRLTADLFSPRADLVEIFEVEVDETTFNSIEDENCWEIVTDKRYDYLDVDDVIHFYNKGRILIKTVTNLDRDRKHDDEYYRRYTAMQDFDLSQQQRKKAQDDFMALPVYLTVKLK